MLSRITLFGVTLPTYFLLLSLVFSFMVWAVVRRAHQQSRDLQAALDLYIYVVLGGFLGARLFYVFYQESAFYLKNPFQILAFWNGGYVFYGGVLGGLAAGLFYVTKFQKSHYQKWLNFCAPLLSLGYMLGRVACFLSGCCYGKPTESFWAVLMHGAYRHPTQLYAVATEGLLLIFLLWVERRGQSSKLTQNIYPLWMVGHGLGRIFMEAFRADPRGGAVLGLSVSTFISLVLIAIGGGLILKQQQNALVPT